MIRAIANQHQQQIREVLLRVVRSDSATLTYRNADSRHIECERYDYEREKPARCYRERSLSYCSRAGHYLPPTKCRTQLIESNVGFAGNSFRVERLTRLDPA
jgi:hypothetical protein